MCRLESHMVQIPQKPHRRKRFLENEFYARDARYWTGKVKTAERIGSLQPVNKQAFRGTTNKPGRTHIKVIAKPTIVYVVKFTWLADRSLTFLKIGITGNSVLTRFAADQGRYDVKIVHQATAPSRGAARSLESGLHVLFKGRSFRPPVPLLSRGNSECFSHSSDLEQRMRDLIESWHSSVGRARPS